MYQSLYILLIDFNINRGPICKKKIFIQKESAAVFPIMYTGDRTKIRILNFFIHIASLMMGKNIMF